MEIIKGNTLCYNEEEIKKYLDMKDTKKVYFDMKFISKLIKKELGWKSK